MPRFSTSNMPFVRCKYTLALNCKYVNKEISDMTKKIWEQEKCLNTKYIHKNEGIFI